MEPYGNYSKRDKQFERGQCPQLLTLGETITVGVTFSLLQTIDQSINNLQTTVQSTIEQKKGFGAVLYNQ